jgi:tetratricopeptide (TPR) repeat protein
MNKRIVITIALALTLAAGAAGTAFAAALATEDPAGQEKDAIAYKQAYALVLEEKWAAAKTAMDELVRQFPKSAWVDDARFWSCYALGQTGRDPEAVFKCYRKFVDENPGSEWVDEAKSNMVRLAHSLYRAGKPQYQTIIESYEDAAEDDIKLTALYALQNIGDESALKTIVSIYDKASGSRLKSQIVFMLAEMESPEAVAKLRDIALRETDEEVRRTPAGTPYSPWPRAGSRTWSRSSYRARSRTPTRKWPGPRPSPSRRSRPRRRPPPCAGSLRRPRTTRSGRRPCSP